MYQIVVKSYHIIDVPGPILACRKPGYGILSKSFFFNSQSHLTGFAKSYKMTSREKIM